MNKSNSKSRYQVVGNPAFTDEELIAWAEVQRKLYAEGRLSADKVAALESTVGWSWDIAPEQQAHE